MIKYVAYWILLVVILIWLLHSIASLAYTEPFSDFYILLNVFGFSTILSTIVISTKIIFDKINK